MWIRARGRIKKRVRTSRRVRDAHGRRSEPHTARRSPDHDDIQHNAPHIVEYKIRLHIGMAYDEAVIELGNKSA